MQVTANAGPRSDLQAALTGAPAAQAALRELLADPLAPRRVHVVGPGGHGKSVLLDALSAAWSAAGVPVLRAVPPGAGPLDAGAALVVDDAHRLPDERLARLTELAADPDGRIVVAHRPHPEPAALAALGAVLAERRRPVVLDVLDRTGVAARAARLLGEPAPDAYVDWVRRQTGGVPALVERLLAATLERGTSAGTELPAALLTQLGYAIEALDAGVRGLLLARAHGAPAEPEVLAPLLGLAGDPAGEVDGLVRAAWAEGRLGTDGAAVPLVSAAVLARTAPATITETRRELAEIQLARGGDVVEAARGLIDSGASGARIAAILAAAADEAARIGADAADELYEAAVRAGTPALELAARRAETAVVAGHLDRALAHADRVLGAVDKVSPADALRAGAVAAAVLARRGNLARSAELYRWMTRTAPDGPARRGVAVVSVPALIGTGALEEARDVLGARSADGPPTLLSGAEELLAQGVYDSVAGSGTAAMSRLVRAAALLDPPGSAALLPDTPAALAALVAVQCGELAVAQTVLERAVRGALGGSGAGMRHRLLLGWIAMYRGAHGAARAALAAGRGARLEPRDELLAAALEVALARRASDPAALAIGWARAREAIVHHPVDLYVLQPLGELRVAAARLREQSWVTPHLDEAAALLRALGDPLLWAAPLHWAGVHAAMFADTPTSAESDVAALEAGSSTSRYAAAMAVGARQWLRVLGGDVDAVAVEAAARGLHAVGLSWDGGRLAGQAAIRTRDKPAMGALLGVARALQNAGQQPAESLADTGPLPVVHADRDDRSEMLSEREREVAALVLEGLTYKQIGERLFISAKTVEHHVARMRQRLGSTSRGELFAHLRGIVG